MRQRFTATLVIAALAALDIVVCAATAHAQSQPSLAVLGLEVIDDGTGIDPETTELAKVLTQALRDRTKLRKSPYRLAPNSEKDLLEMKLLSGCADEARNCMASIGRDLGAQWLMFGKVEKRDTGFQVTLKLLNVETMAMERVTTEVIPFADNTGPGLTNKWSRTLFNRLTGIPEQGNLSIEASVSEGRVFVDGELATTLRRGKARIDGLAEGKHAVAIEADGHARYEATVTITPGETEGLGAQLEPIAVGPGPGPGPGPVGPVDGGSDGRGLTRALFWTTAVATGVSGAVWAVSGYQYQIKYKGDKEDAIEAYQEAAMIGPDAPSEQSLSGSDACADAKALVPPDAAVDALEQVISVCDKGESWALRSTIGSIATGVFAVASAYLFYRGYIAEPSGRDDLARAGKRSERPAVQVEPTITPDYFGAGVTIEF